MAETPEGRMKRKIKKVLDSHGERLYKFMPIQTGYGAATIDYLICANGMFIGIEAKGWSGLKPTARQAETLRRIDEAGGETFVIDGDDSLAQFEQFLAKWMSEFK